MKTRLRDWSRRTFYDPEPILRELRNIELAMPETDKPDATRRLRTNRLKTTREGRDALIFAYGMGTMLGAKVFVAPGETEDCDFITMTRVDDTDHFSCVQLKELAPEDLNPSQTLESLLAGLNGRPQSDALLAIHLNRRTTIQLTELRSANVPFSDVWYFWATDPTMNSWGLYGGATKQASPHVFEYPR